MGWHWRGLPRRPPGRLPQQGNHDFADANLRLYRDLGRLGLPHHSGATFGHAPAQHDLLAARFRLAAAILLCAAVGLHGPVQVFALQRDRQPGGAFLAGGLGNRLRFSGPPDLREPDHSARHPLPADTRHVLLLTLSRPRSPKPDGAAQQRQRRFSRAFDHAVIHIETGGPHAVRGDDGRGHPHDDPVGCNGSRCRTPPISVQGLPSEILVLGSDRDLPAHHIHRRFDLAAHERDPCSDRLCAIGSEPPWPPRGVSVQAGQHQSAEHDSAVPSRHHVFRCPTAGRR
mmetsp:Transcript_11110/g.29775  ORF Transcript_11110/g.29775 Transcript_11110/m.29775 type:complete len:286 (-) Transcript_11110:2992-3849(-)